MLKIEDIPPTKNGVVLYTKNPIHETHFKWTIENATKCPQQVLSPTFRLESCQNPKFRLVVKSSNRYPKTNITAFEIAIERKDDRQNDISGAISIKLSNFRGRIYNRKDTRFFLGPKESPVHLFSELFCDFSTKLDMPKAFSHETTNDLLALRAANLVGSYKDSNKIFKLPQNVLVVEGSVKCFGCCVRTESSPVPTIQEQYLQKFYKTEELLKDFELAYKSEVGYDVELKVGEDSIMAHKFILSCRSSVFKDLLQEEKLKNSIYVVEVEHVSKSTMEALLWFLYTGNVMDLSFEEICQLYKASNKYKVFSLQYVCGEKMSSSINLTSVLEILEHADSISDKCVMKKATDYIIDNYSQIEKTPKWQIIISGNPVLPSKVLQNMYDVMQKGRDILA